MSDEKNIRHRFTVPAADTDVNEWIENQSNLGFSLRILIKSFIREFGSGQDATCLAMGTPVKKLGRPANKDKAEVRLFDGYFSKPGNASADDDLQDAEPSPPPQDPPAAPQYTGSYPEVQQAAPAPSPVPKSSVPQGDIDLNDINQLGLMS